MPHQSLTDDCSSSASIESRSLLQDPPDKNPPDKQQQHEGGSDLSADAADEHHILLQPFVSHTADAHLTTRALLAGAVLGVQLPPAPLTLQSKRLLTRQQALVVAMNINFGLKVGWTQGGNILAAVVGIRCASDHVPKVFDLISFPAICVSAFSLFSSPPSNLPRKKRISLRRSRLLRAQWHLALGSSALFPLCIFSAKTTPLGHSCCGVSLLDFLVYFLLFPCALGCW